MHITAIEPATLLSAANHSRVVEMAWEDRTAFEAIETQFGLNESAVVALMRRYLLPSSFRMWRRRTAMPNFEPTRPAALARLAAVQPDDYARSRNALDGAVTRLSPHGLLSLGEVYSTVHARHPLDAKHKFVFELDWRAYWRQCGSMWVMACTSHCAAAFCLTQPNNCQCLRM